MPEGKEITPKTTVERAIRRTDQEPILSTGEINAGIKIPHEYEIPPEAGEAGLALAKESAQPNMSPTLKVPMTKQQAEVASKGSIFNSATWLGTLIGYLFKKQERTA